VEQVRPDICGRHPPPRVSRMRGFRQWRWHLDEMYVKLGGEMVYLWRAVDQEGEILESFVTKRRDKEAALTFMKKALKRHGSHEKITTDGLRSYRAAMNELGNADIPLDSIGAHRTDCSLGRVALLHPRMDVDRHAQAQYVHTDRHRCRRGLSLQPSRNAHARAVPIGIPNARHGACLL
jgi:transposase-like protein